MSLGGLMIMMIVAGMIFLALRGSRALNRGQQQQQLGAGPVRYGETPLGDAARASLDADITRFGDELRDLDLDVVGLELSEEARANYSEALDAYENAKQAMNQARYESDATAIAHILEEGRYAMACVKSREVPACALDAARVTSGADPHIRMVQQGYQAVPYWQDQGHAAYARGYYEPYGLDPVVQGLAKGALLFGGFSLLMGLLDD